MFMVIQWRLLKFLLFPRVWLVLFCGCQSHACWTHVRGSGQMASTPRPPDEALQSDIVFAKRLGYNLLRKHIKVRCAWICLLFLAEHFRFVRTC